MTQFSPINNPYLALSLFCFISFELFNLAFIFLLMLINESLVPVVTLQGPLTADGNLSKTAGTPLFISAKTLEQLYVCLKTIFGNFISNKGVL